MGLWTPCDLPSKRGGTAVAGVFALGYESRKFTYCRDVEKSSRLLSNQSCQAAAGRSPNQPERKTSTLNFRTTQKYVIFLLSCFRTRMSVWQFWPFCCWFNFKPCMLCPMGTEATCPLARRQFSHILHPRALSERYGGAAGKIRRHFYSRPFHNTVPHPDRECRQYQKHGVFARKLTATLVRNSWLSHI